MKFKEGVKRIGILSALLTMVTVSSFFGCEKKPAQTPVTTVNEDPVEEPSIFIYSDTCIVVKSNKSEQSFTFQNLETGLRYTLSYDNLTFFTDSHAAALTASQVTIGQICNISFYREEKRLKSLEVSPDYFSYSNVEGFKFYNAATRMEYLGDKYELDENLVVCSGKETIDRLEIADNDVITIHGNGHKIYSINVDKGHGYISLENDKYFIDGFIEVNKDIRKISEDMMITVPEGHYNVQVSKDGTSAVKEVTVGRNQEATIDLGDIEIKKNFGSISFTVEPGNALLYIDGEKVNDIGKPVKMEYGIHEIIVRADGYESISRYISVGSPTSDVTLKLNKLTDDTDSEEKEDSSENVNTTTNTDTSTNTNTNTNTENTTENNTENNTNTENNQNTASTKVYIDAPSGAELYLDGNYIGVVPTSFDKKIGTIVVTLKKEGCQPRSYTINVEDLTTDSRYSFSELLKLE